MVEVAVAVIGCGGCELADVRGGAADDGGDKMCETTGAAMRW